MSVLKISDVMTGRDETVRLRGAYRFDDLQTEDDVICDWRVEREVAGVGVHGQLHADLVLECVRCLQPYPLAVDVTIDEKFVLSHFVDPYEREKELSAADFFETVDEEGVLDLQDLAHQFLIMESTAHPFCGRSECRVAESAAGGA